MIISRSPAPSARTKNPPRKLSKLTTAIDTLGLPFSLLPLTLTTTSAILGGQTPRRRFPSSLQPTNNDASLRLNRSIAPAERHNLALYFRHTCDLSLGFIPSLYPRLEILWPVAGKVRRAMR
ncbi:hypothetical protein BJX70DRAFT_215000 [Aspergillus crustosus]